MPIKYWFEIFFAVFEIKSEERKSRTIEPEKAKSKVPDPKVEEALRVLRQPSLEMSYDPINLVFVNHAKERAIQLRQARLESSAELSKGKKS